MRREISIIRTSVIFELLNSKPRDRDLMMQTSRHASFKDQLLSSDCPWFCTRPCQNHRCLTTFRSTLDNPVIHTCFAISASSRATSGFGSCKPFEVAALASSFTLPLILWADSNCRFNSHNTDTWGCHLDAAAPLALILCTSSACE